MASMAKTPFKSTPYVLSIVRFLLGCLFIQQGLKNLWGLAGGRIDRDFSYLHGLAGPIELDGGVFSILGQFNRPTAFIWLVTAEAAPSLIKSLNSPLSARRFPVGLSFIVGILGIFPCLIQATPDLARDSHLSKVPLAFESNMGQYGPGIKFVARSAAGAISLGARSASFHLRDAKLHTARLDMTPVGMTHLVSVEGLEETEGKSNYLFGADPANWITNVPRYSRVRYRDVYPGIDLIFRGSQRGIEYDFILSPGADPERVELEFTGARSLRLERGGDLIVTLARGLTLTHHAPLLFQEENGVRTKVAGSYVIRGKNRVGFRISSYIRSRTLIIDPVVGYSAQFGGEDPGFANAIAADAAGNAYVTGVTGLSAFPVLPSSFEAGNTTQYSAFVYKLNSSGDFLYTTLIGGSSRQSGTGIAVDADGNAYVTGVTSSADFPVTSGAFQTVLSSANRHGFVLKLNAAGNALVYSTFIGGNYPDLPAAIAIDQSANAYITGSTESSTFPVTPGAYQTSSDNPDGEAFVTKFNSTGTALIYSTYLDNSSGGNGIALDSSGNAYISGSTNIGGVVTKMNSTGSGLVYSTSLHAGTGSFASGIAVDASGNAYVAGTGVATLLGTPVLFGNGGIFVVKLNAAGSALSYLTSVGGSMTQQSTGIALDSGGNIYVSGWTQSEDFPLLSPVQAVGPPADNGVKTGVVFKLDPSGVLAFSTYFGSDFDFPNAIAVDPNSNVYITGTSSSTVSV
jgi:hypothetical protein